MACLETTVRDEPPSTKARATKASDYTEVVDATHEPETRKFEYPNRAQRST
jgi:hypothetical protein